MGKRKYAELGLAIAADQDSEVQEARRRFEAALKRVPNRKARIALEETFNDAWIAAAHAVADQALA